MSFFIRAENPVFNDFKEQAKTSSSAKNRIKNNFRKVSNSTASSAFEMESTYEDLFKNDFSHRQLSFLKKSSVVPKLVNHLTLIEQLDNNGNDLIESKPKRNSFIFKDLTCFI